MIQQAGARDLLGLVNILISLFNMRHSRDLKFSVDLCGTLNHDALYK